jgi:hypothetical protein
MIPIAWGTGNGSWTGFVDRPSRELIAPTTNIAL